MYPFDNSTQVNITQLLFEVFPPSMRWFKTNLDLDLKYKFGLPVSVLGFLGSTWPKESFFPKDLKRKGCQ